MHGPEIRVARAAREFLPHQQRDYAFTLAGTKKTREAPRTVLLDFKSVSLQPPTTTWKENCMSADLPGRWRGRVWVDGATGDVLRLDEQLIGTFDVRLPKAQARRSPAVVLTIERAERRPAIVRSTFTIPMRRCSCRSRS